MVFFLFQDLNMWSGFVLLVMVELITEMRCPVLPKNEASVVIVYVKCNQRLSKNQT